MRRQGLFVHWLRFRLAQTSRRTIRPIGVKNPFYFTTKPAVSKDPRVFRRITLKIGKKTLRLFVPVIIHTRPIRPKCFKRNRRITNMELRPRRTSNIKVPVLQSSSKDAFGHLRRGPMQGPAQRPKVLVFKNINYSQKTCPHDHKPRPSHLASRRVRRGRLCLVFK